MDKHDFYRWAVEMAVAGSEYPEQVIKLAEEIVTFVKEKMDERSTPD